MGTDFTRTSHVSMTMKICYTFVKHKWYDIFCELSLLFKFDDAYHKTYQLSEIVQ